MAGEATIGTDEAEVGLMREFSEGVLIRLRSEGMPIDRVGLHPRDRSRRENFLGVLGPLLLFVRFGAWAFVLILGFALLHWGAGDHIAAPVRLATVGFDLFYGTLHAVRDVTLEIASNSVTAIIGPSGCGKSTLLRAFNRMNDLLAGVRTRGEVRVSGRNILEPTTDVVELRRRVGMVFQRPNPFPKSIFDNVVFGLRLLGIRNPL